MLLSYTVTCAGTYLCVTQRGVTAPIYSPHFDWLVYANEESPVEGKPALIELTTMLYPMSAQKLLPPLLLLETLDEPREAEALYEQHEGYRYLAQFLFADATRGESCTVCLTREALSSWRVLEAKSEIHVRGMNRFQQDMTALFHLPGFPLDSNEDGESSVVADLARQLQQADEHQRIVALNQACQRGIKEEQLVPCVFPCLNDSSALVRERAKQVLLHLTAHIPVDALEHVVDCGPQSARVAATELLGVQGGKRAELILLATRWRRNAAVRKSALVGLASANPSGIDTLSSLKSALDHDEATSVRACAARLLGELPNIEGVHVLRTAAHEERDPLVLQAIEHALVVLEQQIVGVQVSNSTGSDFWLHSWCYERLASRIRYTIKQRITFLEAQREEHTCASCTRVLTVAPATMHVHEEEREVKSEANEEYIPAFLAPDECPGVSFDASAWFTELATDRDLLQLRADNYNGEMGDNIARFLRSDDQGVASVLAYCENTQCGYSCTASSVHVDAWIARHRPHLID